MSSIPVGILGATGMVGQQFIALLADHPWFKVEWLGASQRSEGKAFRDAAAWRLPNRLPDDVAQQGRRGGDARARAPKLVFSGLDSSVAGEIEGAFAAGRPHHRQQLAQLPDGRHGAAADSRSERRPPGAARRAGRGAGLEGPHHHQPELRDGRARDGARAAAAVRARRPRWSRRCRRSPAPAIRACRRGTSSATSFRTSAAARKRRSKPRRGRFSARSANGKVDYPSGEAERDDDARAGAERAHRIDFGRARAAADAGSDHRRVDLVPRPAAGARSCRRRRRSRSSTSPKRTGRSRCSTSTATAA